MPARIQEHRTIQPLLPRRLLLAVDGSTLSDHLVGHALALGVPFDAAITVVRVLDGAGPRGKVDVLEFEMARTAAERYVAGLALRLEQGGVTADTCVVQGRVPEQLLHHAQEHGFDAIVLSSHGEGGLSTFALGGTASKIVHGASSSLLVVPGQSGPLPNGFRVIFVPLDGSTRSECVLPLVERLAVHHRAEVVLYHAVAIPSCPRRTLPSREDEALATRLTEHNRDTAAAYVAQLARQLEGKDVVVRTRVEVTRRVARSISDAATEEAADLMVLSAHGETGDPEERHGTVAAQFLRRPLLPTLVVQDLPVDTVVTRTPQGAVRRSLSGRVHPDHSAAAGAHLFAP